MIRVMEADAPPCWWPAALRIGRAARLVRFGVVGVSGVGINTGLLVFLVQAISLNHVMAAACSAEASILSNFVLNDRWTFRDSARRRPFLHRAGRYNLVALGGNVISLAAFAFLSTACGIQYLIANLVAIGLGTASNYILNSRFTWTKPTEELVRAAA